MILTKTIRSILDRNEIYGNAGEEVKLIADHGNVLIVANAVGFRFPVNTEFVSSDDEPVIVQEEIIPVAEPSRKTKGKKVQPQIQNSLF